MARPDYEAAERDLSSLKALDPANEVAWRARGLNTLWRLATIGIDQFNSVCPCPDTLDVPYLGQALGSAIGVNPSAILIMR